MPVLPEMEPIKHPAIPVDMEPTLKSAMPMNYPEMPESWQMAAPTVGPLNIPASKESLTVEKPAAGEREDGIRPLLETIITKIDALVDRPINLSVTTTLGGRRIAEAVYKDIREQRIRNYETL